jgi:hypothetical protein
MSENGLALHIKVVGWLHILGAFLLVAGGLFVFLFFAGIGVGSGDWEAIGILGAIGSASAIFMILVALPGLVAGWGILNQKTWSRMAGIVVGILELAIIPVGTMIGGYTLWVLTDKKSADYFEPTPLAS